MGVLREEEQMQKDKEKAMRRKEKKERKNNGKYKKSPRNKQNENEYSMKRIAQNNKNKKDALSSIGVGGDLFTSLDSIANKIKKEQNEKNRIVYNSTGNKNRF